jgi:acyl phosphate:glycerol-3-phosphate acyltransferase
MTSNELIAGVGVTVAAYLLGCITAGWYLVRWRTGGDLRQLGSGSVGGRNTARVVGVRWAAIAVAVDVLKGALAAWLALVLAPAWVGLALVAVVAGHVWPVQLGGHGGRGLAPSVGSVAVAAPFVVLVVAGTFVVLALVARSTLIPSIAAAIAAPAWAVGLSVPVTVTLGIAGVATVIVLGHLAPLRLLAARLRQPVNDSGPVR